MSKLQGFIKPIQSTTLRIWRRERDEIELAWDGQDILLYQNGKFLRKITDTPSVSVEVWDPTKAYLAGDNFVSYKSPDYDILPESDPLSEEYIYRCTENTNAGESPESHPDKWQRQGKVGTIGDNTIFLSDVSGLEDALNERIKYTDLSDEFTVNPDNNQVSLNIDYITLTDFSGKDYIQPDPLPAANIRLSSTSVNIAEGGSTIVTVVLDREPTDDVVLSITSQDTNIATVVQYALTFTTANYDIPQNIQINGVSDANSVTDSTTITVTVSSSNDSNYNNLTSKYISVDVADLDNADYILSKSNMSITEGTSDTFNVRLATESTSNVNISVSSSDTNVATVSSNSLTFTPLNYNTNQTVTVNAIEDTDIGDKNTSITLNVSSTNPSYGNLPNKSVAITSIDNDLQANEVKIGDTIWKTSNESWDDGGTGIYYPNGDINNVSKYGLLYNWDAVQRLLLANPGYRIPTYIDLEDLADQLTVVLYSTSMVYDASSITSNSSDIFGISNPQWDNILNLSLVPAGGYADHNEEYYDFNTRGNAWYINNQGQQTTYKHLYSSTNEIPTIRDLNVETSVSYNPAFSVRLVKDI
jgi:uncharacterized protein (TIGR02145 family)